MPSLNPVSKILKVSKNKVLQIYYFGNPKYVTFLSKPNNLNISRKMTFLYKSDTRLIRLCWGANNSYENNNSKCMIYRVKSSRTIKNQIVQTQRSNFERTGPDICSSKCTIGFKIT